MAKYQTVPVIVSGPSYRDRSRPLTSQTTINFYPEFVESGSDRFITRSFPGLSLFSDQLSGGDRGGVFAGGVLYRVLGNTLYSVSNIGTHTNLGAVSGGGRCIFATDGTSIWFTTGGGPIYKYDGASLTQVTDSNIVGSRSVTSMNNQFVYTKPKLSVVSDVGNGSSASGLNAIGAESIPDDLVRDYWFDQVLYRFGTESVEPWYNSGVGNPPIARIEGQIITVGTASRDAITNTKDFIYWLGNDNSIYRARGGVDAPVSSKGVNQAIEGYADISDAIANSFVLDGKYFVAFQFPSANATWVVSEELGENGWFELSSSINGGGIYQVSTFISAYGKKLAFDSGNGNIYELDFDVHDLNGETMQRRRVMSSINGKALGFPGKRMQMSRFELLMEVGTGIITGQGEDPKIMIEASYDGGKSWSEETWMDIGRLGETDIRAEWFNLDSFYDLMIRLTITDPVPCTIYSGAIDVRPAGR
jgi:hypothetical protein